MSWIIDHLWLIPAVPFAASLVILSLSKLRRKSAVVLAITGQVVALAMSVLAFLLTLQTHGFRAVQNFTWFTFGEQTLRLGFVLDPLAAAMLVMISLVGLCIFVFSVGYMAKDTNFTCFFAYMSFFSGAMLGLVIANSLLLLFIFWELVGLASYLLIGFWIERPSAAGAAKKAFITTRIGDMGFFLGMLWLYNRSGTLLFYDSGNDGCRRGVPCSTRLSAFLIGRNQRRNVVAHGRCVDRSDDSVDGSAHRNRPGGHQAHSGLLDRLATWFDDGLAWGRRGCCWDNALARARFFQSPPVPRCRLRDSRMPRRTGHSQNGRTPPLYASNFHDVRGRHDGAQRCADLLLRRLDQRGNSSCHSALAAVACALLPDSGRSRSHRALHDATNHLRLLRQPARCCRACTRESTCHDDASDRVGVWRNFVERCAYACMAVAARVSSRRTYVRRRRAFNSADAVCFARAR